MHWSGSACESGLISIVVIHQGLRSRSIYQTNPPWYTPLSDHLLAVTLTTVVTTSYYQHVPLAIHRAHPQSYHYIPTATRLTLLYVVTESAPTEFDPLPTPFLLGVVLLGVFPFLPKQHRGVRPHARLPQRAQHQPPTTTRQ